MANQSLALDLELFDVTKNGYAPAEQPKRKIQQPKLLRENQISGKRAYAEAKVSRAAAVRACAFALMMLIVIGSLIYCRVVLTNRNIELNNAKTELAASQSEYTSLEMKYHSLLAPDKVEAYARDELGMVKRENYQIRYFDISGKDGAQPIK